MSCRYFENRSCEFYPCHEAQSINCLFCFCPLYHLDCGGNFETIDGLDGRQIKDCSKCLIPHSECGYDYVIEKLNILQNEGKRGVLDGY